MLHRLAAADGIAIHDNQFLVVLGGGLSEQTTPERNLPFLRLLPREQQRAHAIGTEDDHAPQLRLRRLGVVDEFPDLGKPRDEADLVTDGDYGFGRSAQMLGHGNINGRGQRKHLNGALAGDLAVVRMDAADGECRQFSHCFPPFSVQRSGERPVQARRPVSEPEPLSAAGASGN